MKNYFKNTIFLTLLLGHLSVSGKTIFKMVSGEHLPDFRLLCSNGKSYTKTNFSDSKNLVLLFLAGEPESNKKCIEQLKFASKKYTSGDVAFVVISLHLNKEFPETDTSNHSNFTYLIDYHDNLFSNKIISSNEPVLVVFNENRQLFFQEELIVTSNSYIDLFSKRMNEQLSKSVFEFENSISKGLHIADKTYTDKNYGLSVNIINLNDKEFFHQNILNKEKVLLYFWSTKWDVSMFELEDLNFTAQVLKSVGIRLIPINVDGKKNLKKVWLNLFNNSCSGEHYVSEHSISDSKFASFNDMISVNNNTNYVLLSKDGEMLCYQKNIVSLIEMRKHVISSLKKKANQGNLLTSYSN